MRKFLIAAVLIAMASPALAQYPLAPYPDEPDYPPSCNEACTRQFRADMDAWSKQWEKVSYQNAMTCRSYPEPDRTACRQQDAAMREAAKN